VVFAEEGALISKHVGGHILQVVFVKPLVFLDLDFANRYRREYSFRRIYFLLKLRRLRDRLRFVLVV
jgi:hypothetical protein